MHRVVPELIVENYRAGIYGGEFSAIGMFLDLSGFSTMTDALMQHGQHGAEVLAGLMHSVFDPLVESVFDYGGKIVGFAGDGIMALYPMEGDAKAAAMRALTSAYVIQKRLDENPMRQTIYGRFPISAKIGLASGSVSWGILRSSDGEQATYYFRGSAVDEAAEAEHHAKPGDILLARPLGELLNTEIDRTIAGSYLRFGGFHVEPSTPNRIDFPPVDLEVSQRFMPQEVIAYDVRGEFRQVVNLFLRFPNLSDDQLDELLGRVFELRSKYGGLLSRLDFGDKGCNLLMLWGAPLAYENDIVRALEFLLDLQSQVEFPITSGVTYYIAHAGYLGSGMCEDYTCYGWGVNLASRFMMSAPPGEIWVDDRIARRVSRRFELEFVGTQPFKGFAAPEKVHRLHGHKELQGPIYQGELVGRGQELAQLARFIEPLWKHEFAGLLLVAGDAGVGKGRLIHDFRASKIFDERSVLWAVCPSDQILRRAFNPLRSWLSKYFGISPNQSSEERKQLFAARLDDLLASIPDPILARELDRTRSLLGALLDLHWEDSLYEHLDAQGRYNNTLLALIALFKTESLHQPVVIFLEDLQFTDQDSKRFLSRLKRAVLAAEHSYPLAIIVTTRPSDDSLEPDLVDARMDLGGISPDSIARLAETMLGSSAAPGLVTLLWRRSEGNPYFVEQIIRYLQEENLIEMSREGWSLVKRLGEDFLPGDIRSILVARLDQLTREVKLSIQTASVLGREFELRVLLQMLRGDEMVPAYIAEAEKAGIWAPLNEILYIFSHGLLRDAAYEMQMRARRQELHAAAVEALETVYADDLKPHYAELAYHTDHAGLASQAQNYYRLAGRVSADHFQNSQAIDYLTRALDFTAPEDLSIHYDLLVEREDLFNRVGDRSAQLQDLKAIEALAIKLADPRRLAKAKTLQARYFFATGDYHATDNIARSVDFELTELEHADIAIGLYILWSQALFRLGRLDEAMQYAAVGLQLARRSGRRVDEGLSLTSMGLIALESKKPGRAHKYLEDALAIARETKARTLESRAIANLANSAAFIQRDYVAARSYYEQASSIDIELGDRYAHGIALGNIGWVCGMLGDFAAAQTYHEQALINARELGNRYQETYTLMNLSRVAEVQQRAAEAVQYARDAVELSQRAGDKTAEAWSYLYLGYALLLNQFEEARIAFDKALQIRRELGQISLATEPIAGLIQAALAVNDAVVAKQWMEELVVYLSGETTLDTTEEPLRVYLACYAVLERLEDPRALPILDKAKQLLESQVSNIDDEQARRMYIDNVPWRRAIEQAWVRANARP